MGHRGAYRHNVHPTQRTDKPADGMRPGRLPQGRACASRIGVRVWWAVQPEETVTITRDPATGHSAELCRQDDGAIVVVRETLESWTHPKFGQVAGVTLNVLHAHRLLAVDASGGEPYEATVRQYGNSGHGVWHLRRPVSEQLRAALHASGVEYARAAFERDWSTRNRETLAGLVRANRQEGFSLGVDRVRYHRVTFTPAEFDEILREAARS